MPCTENMDCGNMKKKMHLYGYENTKHIIQEIGDFETSAVSYQIPTVGAKP